MTTFYDFQDQFPDDDACLEHIMTIRYGVAAKELQRQLSVSYPTALCMINLIRQHMADFDGEKQPVS